MVGRPPARRRVPRALSLSRGARRRGARRHPRAPSCARWCPPRARKTTTGAQRRARARGAGVDRRAVRGAGDPRARGHDITTTDLSIARELRELAPGDAVRSAMRVLTHLGATDVALPLGPARRGAAVPRGRPPRDGRADRRLRRDAGDRHAREGRRRARAARQRRGALARRRLRVSQRPQRDGGRRLRGAGAHRRAPWRRPGAGGGDRRGGRARRARRHHPRLPRRALPERRAGRLAARRAVLAVAWRLAVTRAAVA